MCKKNDERDAYVLTRIYNDYSAESIFAERFRKAAESVARNAINYESGRVFWVIYDDSPYNVGYYDHKRKLDESLEQLYATFGRYLPKSNVIYVRREDCSYCNSAYAAHCLRGEFLEVTQSKKTAFAVLLDQDDELEPYAIRQIASKMTDNSVVLLPFTIINDGGKDITADGGRAQVELTKSISECRVLPNREITEPQEICYASTMGWSKAYSRQALEIYHQALEDFLYTNRGGTLNFFNSHPAYEDFLDFYILLRNEITITATTYKTHKYYKHKDAITSMVDLDAFRLHRTGQLLALIDLCYADKDNLQTHFKQLLLRYITVKVVDIERILHGYRQDYKKGDKRYYNIHKKTKRGYFIKELYCSADEKATKNNFDDLFSRENFNSITAYDSVLRKTNSYSVIKKAYSEENKFRKSLPKFQKWCLSGVTEVSFWAREIKNWCKNFIKNHVWKGKKVHQDEIEYLNDGKPTPNQRYYRKLRLIFYFWLIIGLLLFGFGIRTGLLKLILNKDYGQAIAIVFSASVSTLIAVLTWILNERGKTRILADEEGNKKKLYFSEFEDLIRHLEANLKVMIEIRYQLSKSKKVPADVHFINLAWPSTSCLFSDDITSLIEKDKVDDFARLKVNLRNIQNSSNWLSQYVKEKHTTDEIREALDWEITRHIGYLLNFKYLKDHNFQSAQKDQLLCYIGDHSLKMYLAKLFLPYPTDKEKLAQVEEYLRRYHHDRNIRRSVLLN